MPQFVELHLIYKQILGTPKPRLYHDFENEAGNPNFITSWSLEIEVSPKKNTETSVLWNMPYFPDRIPTKFFK